MRAVFLLALCALLQPAYSAALPTGCKQLIVGLAETWDSGVGTIQCFERDGKGWHAVSRPQRVLFGAKGLAWGIGVAGQEQPGLHKVEGDNRAPAGIFALGKVYTYESKLPLGADYPFYTVGPADAWISNPALPHYNQHVVVDLKDPPAWFEKERMRQNDVAHWWKIEIRHNEDPPASGAGSAIFFHIQRGENIHSSGCTTMPEPAILGIIRWLRDDERPHYALLPAAEYRAKWKSWGLPAPELVAALGAAQ